MMNVKDDKCDELLERIVDLAESGHELTDDELASMMQDKDAMRAYREMMLMKNAVNQYAENEKASIKMEMSGKRSLLKYAAAILVLIIGIGGYQLFNKQEEKEYLAFECTDEVPEIIVTAESGELRVSEKSLESEELKVKSEESHGKMNKEESPAKNFSHPFNNSSSLSSLHSSLSKDSDGKLVLDYVRAEGYAVSSRVESHTATIPRGKDLKIVLADGSEVFLYADSKLTYPSFFVGKERRVVLRGQAYFKIAKDAAHPFIIHTDNLEARVLGTELNVRSYGKNDGHVALINGSVMVTHSSSARVVLKPGQKASLGADNQIVVVEENMDTYTSWLNGYLFFDDSPMLEVAKALGRWFNVNVIFENEAIKDKHIRYYCLRNESIHQAIMLLNSLKEFQVELKDNTLYIK